MNNKTGFVDIETNNLLSDMVDHSSFPYKLKEGSKIWCISVTDWDTRQTSNLSGSDITPDSVNDLLKDYDVLIAHNGHKFDFPALALLGLIEYKVGYLGEKDILNGKEVRLFDTLIFSRFLNPDRYLGHSLGSWGKRVDNHKTDYRKVAEDLGVIEKGSPKGAEFRVFHEKMVEYCDHDTVVTMLAYEEMLKEAKGYDGFQQGIQLEHKLADLAFRREELGFKFDKELALQNLMYLEEKLEELAQKVDPLLPRKKMTQADISFYTPPKNPFKKDGTPSTHLINFLKRTGAELITEPYVALKYEDKEYPIDEPLKTHIDSTINDMDVVKSLLLEHGWEPTEWRERDITKNSKKQALSPLKKKDAIERYVRETLEGKYKKERLEILGVKEDKLLAHITKNAQGNRYILPTSPSVRVGVVKELCPNLVSLGEKVEFGKYFSEYLTYKSRRNNIAGGDLEGLDLEDDAPEKGYLARVREDDGRIATPAIEMGTNTFRYSHIGVANIPRNSSLFGEQMRALFCAGDPYIQLGYDYSSLEARIEGSYVFNYEGGEELAESLIAEKPNDIHTLKAKELDIDRDSAKSVGYAMLYGASPNKFVKMLSYTLSKAQQFYNDWWESMPSLKELKEDKEREWVRSGKQFITSIDGRRVLIRSKHSILNALFQSAGVIFTKYVMVKTLQKIESKGYCIDVFKGIPDIAEMISYHDEAQMMVKKELLKFKVFNNKEEAVGFQESWQGNKLGTIQEGKDGKYFITLPNIMSESLNESIREVEELLGLNVQMDYEYVTGRNWKDCH